MCLSAHIFFSGPKDGPIVDACRDGIWSVALCCCCFLHVCMYCSMSPWVLMPNEKGKKYSIIFGGPLLKNDRERQKKRMRRMAGTPFSLPAQVEFLADGSTVFDIPKPCVISSPFIRFIASEVFWPNPSRICIPFEQLSLLFVASLGAEGFE